MGLVRTTNLRLEEETVAKADSLAEEVSKLLGCEVMRSSIVRGAVERGLERLEASMLKRTPELTDAEQEQLAQDLREVPNEHAEVVRRLCLAWRERGIAGAPGKSNGG